VTIHGAAEHPKQTVIVDGKPMAVAEKNVPWSPPSLPFPLLDYHDQQPRPATL
jgi:hypothetical protein